MKIFKKSSAFILACLLMVSTIPPAFAVEEMKYSDVSSSDWYYEYVLEMSEKGIVNGNPDGTFSPNKPVTIGEYCSMICRALNADIPAVKEGEHWATEYVSYVKLSYGWKSGTLHKNFDEELKRKDAVEIGLRMFDYLYPVSEHYLENPFSDTDNLTAISASYLLNAYHLGIISGNGNGEVRPEDTITKAQACKIISNILKTDLSEPIKPEILNRVDIEFDCKYDYSFYSDICYALTSFDESVIESLSKNAKILITDDNSSKYISNTNGEVSGCFLPNSNTIVCFTNGNASSFLWGIGSTLKHEIAHYVYYNMLTKEEKEIVEKSFNSEEEMALLRKTVLSTYCETNVKEYFAEFVRGYHYVPGYGENNIPNSGFPIVAVVEKYLNIKQ